MILSIVTVTKNCDSTLCRALDSVRKIKNEGVEYLVVDGGSTDSTLDILNSNQDIIDYMISESDSGIYDAMNKGIKRSSGKYIMFLNADDCYLPDSFDQFFRVLTKSDASVISFSSLLIHDDNVAGVLSPNKYLLPFFNSIPHPSTAVKASILRSNLFNLNYNIASDYFLFLSLFLKLYSFKSCGIAIAKHYTGGASSDFSVSSYEVDLIQRQLLGRLYHVKSVIHFLYSFIKRIF